MENTVASLSAFHRLLSSISRRPRQASDFIRQAQAAAALGRAAAFAACTADNSRRAPHAHMGRRRNAFESGKTSGNLRAARERTGLLELDTIAERRSHFTLRRAFAL